MTPLRNSWFALGCLLATLLLGATGCDGHARSDASGNSTRLVVTGSSTVAPVVAELAQAYEKLHPNVRIDVQTGGSSRGIADARSGAAQIGMVSRELHADESDLQVYAIARDGIGFIVHSENATTEMSSQLVRAIYRGEIESWSDAHKKSASTGKTDGIVVVHKSEGRATLDVFLDHFELDNRDVQADVVIGHNEQGIKTVAGNPNAVGYVSIGAAETNIREGVPIRLLPLDGVPATSAVVSRGDFPLSRPLNLVTRDTPTGIAWDFIRFAQSSAAEEIIRGQYFVPISP